MPHTIRHSLPLTLFIAFCAQRTLPAQDVQPPVAKVPVTFLSLDEARAAIVDDSADPYFEKLTAHEMSAKTGQQLTGDTLDAQRKECKALYQAACEAFTDDERQVLTTLLGKIHPAVEHTYPGFAKQPWSFIKVKPTLEGGMPHTRGRHIIVSSRVVGGMKQMSLAGDLGTTAAAGILVHEQTHVIERLHPDLFTDLFTGVFGFRRAKEITPDPWTTARQLINPDGIDTRWIFPLKDDPHLDTKPHLIWPLVIFSDPDAASLHQMTFVGLDLEPTDPKDPVPDTFKLKLDASGEPTHQPLPQIDTYVRAVRTRQSLYHPNEAAADLMARLVIADALGQDGAAGGNDMEPVRAWAKKTFGPQQEPKAKP